VFAAVLVPAVIAVSIVGYFEYELFDDLASAIFLVAIFTIPFVPIALALLEGAIGPIAALVAFATGAASLVVVPWLVEKSVENDPSSTAGLVHLWDPVLMTGAVGLVILVAWLLRRAHHICG